jgi:uncharacterized protein
MLKKTLFIVLLFIQIVIFAQTSNYDNDIEKWRTNRIERLKSENGWLNLAGLFWLNEGENTFGSDKSNNIRFDTKNTADFLGKMILSDSEIWFVSDGNNDVYLDNEIVDRVKIFPYERNPIILKHNNLRWFIIQRGEKFAIRLRDLEGKFLKEFKGIEYFPIDTNYRVEGTFIPTPGKMISITDATGRTYEQESPGKVIFQIDGQELSLEPTGSLRQLSFVFADETTNVETYGGGRFLEANGPDPNNKVILDFNKAYNPPCVFTPYATCPLPTKENKLKIAIKAGEKDSGEHP